VSKTEMRKPVLARGVERQTMVQMMAATCTASDQGRGDNQDAGWVGVMIQYVQGRMYHWSNQDARSVDDDEG
jgi:hypothetical protein